MLPDATLLASAQQTMSTTTSSSNGAMVLPDFVYPMPFVIKNTFIDTTAIVQRADSLNEFLVERQVQSCPASGIAGHQGSGIDNSNESCTTTAPWCSSAAPCESLLAAMALAGAVAAANTYEEASYGESSPSQSPPWRSPDGACPALSCNLGVQNSCGPQVPWEYFSSQSDSGSLSYNASPCQLFPPTSSASNFDSAPEAWHARDCASAEFQQLVWPANQTQPQQYDNAFHQPGTPVSAIPVARAPLAEQAWCTSTMQVAGLDDVPPPPTLPPVLNNPVQQLSPSLLPPPPPDEDMSMAVLRLSDVLGSAEAVKSTLGPEVLLPVVTTSEQLRGPLRGPVLGSDELPSIGSAAHQAGNCKPCAFYHVRGCENAEGCPFCHLCGAGEKKRRMQDKRLARRAAKYGEIVASSASPWDNESMQRQGSLRRQRWRRDIA